MDPFSIACSARASRSASHLRALWEAVCGNAAEGKSNAMALAGDLEKRFPEDTFAKFTYVPVLRALLVP